MLTGERTAAPLETPLEFVSFTAALLVAVALMCNIGYIDPLSFLLTKKKMTFSLSLCSLRVETTLKADGS